MSGDVAMWQTLFSLGAGMATVASPCVLPILPLLLGASLGPAGGGGGSAWRPLAIIVGFVLAFSAAAVLFGASTRVLGVSPEALRTASIVLLAGFGLVLLWPSLPGHLMRLLRPLRQLRRLLPFAGLPGDRRPFSGLVDRAMAFGQGPGLGAALLLGMSLGVVWTPCAGPVLASILALIATQQQPAEAAGLLLAYAAGAGLPMLVIAYGGRAAAQRVRALARHAEALRRGFGVLVLATALAMQAQWDASAAAWLSTLVSAARAEPMKAPPVPADAIAPEFTGLQAWFNSPPLTMAGLKGRVVLVDFWTFSCVNCINTLPHLQRWHQRFAERGLVIVGVHTPEFAHEREAAQVQAAIRRHGIGYAVAQDNRYATWSAWRNQYWPALYLVDRQGRVVFRHVGEGDYAHIEQQIEQALR